MPRWLLWVAASAAAGAALTYAAIASDLGPSGEDRTWEAIIRAHGLLDLFSRAIGTYRPLCGMFVLAEDAAGLTTKGKHGVAAALHLSNLLLLSVLASRILRGPWLGALAGLLAATWSSADEVLVWLGGRCDLLEVTLGLAGSHFALTAIERQHRRALPIALATACCAAACLVKEPAFALPLLWLLYAAASGHALRPLLPPLVAAVFVLLLRSLAAQGLGTYVAYYLERGPLNWASQSVQAAGTLLLGTGVDAGPLALLLAALGTGTALAWLIARQQGAGRRFAVALALALLLGPCALLHAPRCLYPAVMALSVLIVAVVARSPRADWALALFLLGQSSSSVASLLSWQSAYRARRDGVTALAALSSPNTALVLIAARSNFVARPVGPIHATDLPNAESLRFACRPQEPRSLETLLRWRPPAARGERPAQPLHRVHARIAEPCTVDVSPVGLRCASDSVESALDSGWWRVHVEPSARPATLAFVDADGILRATACTKGN